MSEQTYSRLANALNRPSVMMNSSNAIRGTFSAFRVPKGMSFAADYSQTKVYGFGMTGNSSNSRSLFVFSRNEASNDWTTSNFTIRNGAPYARIHPIMAVWKNKVLVFGGLSPNGEALKDSK